MNATGHMLVARIAWDKMTPAARAAVKTLTSDPNDPTTGSPTTNQDNDELTAADWMDDIRPVDKEFHFTDVPLNGNGTIPAGPNSITFLNQQIAILKDPKVPQDNKAEALRFTMHLIGDTHQPLHDSDNNDHGGNGFSLGGKKNLHSFWDAGGDQWSSIPRPLTDDGRAKLTQMATAIENQFPLEKMADKAAETNPADWVHEGWEMAKSDCYTGITQGQAPSAEYTAKARQDMNMEAALGGYRLANLVNSIFT